MKMTPATIPTLVLLSLFGCGEAKKTLKSFAQSSPEIVTVDSAVNSVNGMLDDLADSFQLSATAGCASTTPQDCGAVRSNVRERQYRDCRRSDGYELGGTISLTYSNTTCSLEGLSSSVSRTISTTLSRSDFSLTLNSAPHNDYQGVLHTGGSTLTHIGSGLHTYGIPGLRRLVVEKQEITGDFSVKSMGDAVIAGIHRNHRQVRSGHVRVSDNLNRFAATVEMKNLKWVPGCCYPVEGVLDITFTGNVTGNRQVLMKPCGTFEVRDSSNRSTTMGEFLTCGG